MSTFVFYADWQVGSDVDESLLAAVGAAWEGNDDGLCHYQSRQDTKVLTLSFDVDATTEDEAAQVARRKIEGLAQRVLLPGRLAGLKGYTDDGWFDALPN